MQKPDAAYLRDFRKVVIMSEDSLFEWKSHWKWLGWAHKLGGAEFQEISRVGQTLLARLMETQIWCPPVNSVGTILSKGTMTAARISFRAKAAFPTLLQMLDNSVPPICP